MDQDVTHPAGSKCHPSIRLHKGVNPAQKSWPVACEPPRLQLALFISGEIELAGIGCPSFLVYRGFATATQTLPHRGGGLPLAAFNKANRGNLDALESAFGLDRDFRIGARGGAPHDTRL